MNDDGASANVTETEIMNRNCSQMSDCDAHAQEQCISGVCISRKGGSK